VATTNIGPVFFKNTINVDGGCMNASLFLMNDRGLYLGAGLSPARHAVHALSVYVALSGTLSVWEHAGKSWRDVSAVLVPPDHPHQVDASRALVAHFVLIPETGRARRILASRTASRMAGLPAGLAPSVRSRLLTYLDQGCSNEAAADVCDDLFAGISRSCPAVPAMDARIERALEYVRHSPEYRLPVVELARLVRLSPSRFSHLFHQETGTSIDRYFVWRRLRAALDEMAAAQTLTEVSHRVGFADAAHLSRTFRGAFGTPPSELFGKARIAFTGL
jgi:AraC family transcriptional regulator